MIINVAPVPRPSAPAPGSFAAIAGPDLRAVAATPTRVCHAHAEPVEHRRDAIISDPRGVALCELCAQDLLRRGATLGDRPAPGPARDVYDRLDGAVRIERTQRAEQFISELRNALATKASSRDVHGLLEASPGDGHRADRFLADIRAALSTPGVREQVIEIFRMNV